MKWVLGLLLLGGCRQVFGLDDPIGAATCDEPQVFTSDGTFTLPEGCTGVTIEAWGGGGAASPRSSDGESADGGAGGYAVKTRLDLPAGTTYTITVGDGGMCGSTAMVNGGYKGGGGGNSNGNGGVGEGAPAAMVGAGGMATSGGDGGNGGFGGGGGGGGGDSRRGNSGGGATTVRSMSPMVEIVVAGGGGGAGATDQDGDVAGRGGDACNGYDGTAGSPGSGQGGGGGGGGACACVDGCDQLPSAMGGAGGTMGTSSQCTSAQNGASGHVVITVL